MQRYVDDGILAAVHAVVLENGEPVDVIRCGYADIESRRPVTDDAIYRIYSNTKPITAVAVMRLYEAGSFRLDDPLDAYLPAFRDLRVLRAGAGDPADVERLRARPTIRQLLCHNAGFSYGLFHESPVDALYQAAGILSPRQTLSEMAAALAGIPLACQPGSRFLYSVSSDLLARLVEVWSGLRFGEYLERHIFAPLGMSDTGFHVPPGKHARLVTLYSPRQPLQPMAPGFVRTTETARNSFREPRALESGGGGLVSTLPDYLRFVQMLVNGGSHRRHRMLQPQTLALMRTNQLPRGVSVQFPDWSMPDTVFGLGFALKTAPAAGEPAAAIDEYHWGGMAGTHTFMSPRGNFAALLFTQRMPGFWHPFSHEFRRLVYRAICG
jgi:CubicO group peptidase (beta-lactamase class C family)